MRITRRMEIGRRGEDFASSYLIKNNYKILRRNYRVGFDEIDIIARSMDGTLIFCEVKTFAINSNDSRHGLVPEDNITNAKLKKINRACEMFIAQHENLVSEKMGWRIDCAVVMIDVKNNCTIRYYENI